MFDAMNLAILIGAGLIAASALTSLIGQRIGAPLLLIFLAIGLFAGEDGVLGIEFNSGGAAYFVGSLALAIILFDSGFETPLSSYKVAAAPALTLATLGVVLTTAFVGVGAHYLLNISWIEGLLLGAIVASTDAAAVFLLLRVGGTKLRDRVKSTLEIESGANDPMAIFLTATLVDFAVGSGISAGEGGPQLGWALLSDFVIQIGVGGVIGVVGGIGIASLLNRLGNLEAGLFPITAVAASLVVFSATGLLGGSGFVAAYVAGVVAGNRQIRFASRVRRFQSGLTWLAQIGMFLTLGLLATPSQFGIVAAPSIALALLLIFVARPLAVWLCLLPYGFTPREVLFIGWVGLRGAVSILLAILPGLGGMADGLLFFNVVFIMVLISLIVQGWTIARAARWLKLLVPPTPGMMNRVQIELPGRAEIELVGYRIHPESAVATGTRIPRWARPLIIIRNGRTYSVHNAGPLKANDQVYLFSTPRQVAFLDKVYTSPGGVDEREVLGELSLLPKTTIGEFAREYGLSFTGPPDRTLGDMLHREFHGQPHIGDRMSLGAFDVVVRALDAEGKISEVGLVIDSIAIDEQKRPPIMKKLVSLFR
ncbi:potassium/proton antiporter [Acuticoccus sp. M5D2P5]|uniref:potassium/proton antiporter n=1 Tax=Acuticoccus kalidii TaxID=2910977 RepID=UPI001F15A062|nr:potassium/proton antiporter [Acuticoccus kalidii]MCF3935371.1 potassium/proton antiporter [Acuticoccus kalidii]